MIVISQAWEFVPKGSSHFNYHTTSANGNNNNNSNTNANSNEIKLNDNSLTQNNTAAAAVAAASGAKKPDLPPPPPLFPSTATVTTTALAQSKSAPTLNRTTNIKKTILSNNVKFYQTSNDDSANNMSINDVSFNHFPNINLKYSNNVCLFGSETASVIF